MSDNNYSRAVDYIYDHFLFGSNIKEEDLSILFTTYPLRQEQQQLIIDELAELHIKVLESRPSLAYQVNELIDKIDHNSNLTEKSLREILKNKHFDLTTELLLENFLKEKLSEISNVSLNKEVDNLILEEMLTENFESLDDLLEDDDFVTEMEILESPVDKEFNKDYIKEYQEDDATVDNRRKALENLVRANHRLVLKIVDKYKWLCTSSFDEDDLYQAGMQGLITAANKFDLARENTFSTYAVYWIRQNIIREIDCYSSTVRIPVHMRENIRKIKSTQRDFISKMGENPTIKDLSQMLEIPEDKVQASLDFDYMYNFSSLDKPIGEDKDSCLINFIEDKNCYTPEEVVVNLIFDEYIRNIMCSILSSRDIKILKYRFGFIDGRRYTLEEIGAMENLTRERIRQLEKKSLDKIKKYIIKNRRLEHD